MKIKKEFEVTIAAGEWVKYWALAESEEQAVRIVLGLEDGECYFIKSVDSFPLYDQNGKGLVKDEDLEPYVQEC